MSVQAGIWNFDGKPVDRKLLDDFSEFLKQQGPDGEFCYVDGSVALLYRPFHTTTESRSEHQPHRSPRGFVITWDGRLDNRDELIVDLRSELQVDPSDVAIVAAAFDRWETGCFRRLVGDWAVSIWKPEQRELFFAADYMTIRHIFYYLKKDRIWWSTDLAPLLSLSGDKFHIDDDYVAGYIANDPDPHVTPYREIREVPGGHFLRVRTDTMPSTHRYWTYSPGSRICYNTDAEYEDHFRQLFREAVRHRLRADTPVLAELSGGLDSSSIVCMADEILRKEGAQTPRVDTLSYYDRTEPDGDDWIYIQKLELKRGAVGDHIDASNFAHSATLRYPAFVSMPGCLGGSHPVEAQRAHIVRRGGYRAVLSGIGGDEFLGGVPDPRVHLADLIVQFKIVSLVRQLMAWSLVKRRPWIHLLWQSSIDLLPRVLRQYLSKEANIEPWIAGDFAKRTKLAVRQLGPPESFGMWLPSRRSYIGGVLAMSHKMAKDQASAVLIEETRYPYLDQRLIEFILSIPASQLLRPGERRSLMRRSLTGIVPIEILSRRTKQLGVRTPLIALDRHWDELQHAFQTPISSTLGYINHARLVRAFSNARVGKDVALVRLLWTISLELWLRDLAARHLLAYPPCAVEASTPPHTFRSLAENSDLLRANTCLSTPPHGLEGYRSRATSAKGVPSTHKLPSAFKVGGIFDRKGERT